MSERIDAVLQVLKWPVAVLAAGLLLPAAVGCLELILSCLKNPGPLLPFLAGSGAYLALWLAVLRRWRATLLSTFEHEMTHALFAWLTLHRVVELRTTWKRGGHVKIIGRGNWLIIIAPYFFPTVCFVLVPLFQLFPVIPRDPADAILGAAFMYHITSTMRETHPGQTDLQLTGYIFGALFLPTANLISSGMVLAFARGGWNGLAGFLNRVCELTLDYPLF